MEVTLLGQQYNVGEKPIVILYTYYYINRPEGTPDRHQKQNRNNVAVHHHIHGSSDNILLHRL